MSKSKCVGYNIVINKWYIVCNTSNYALSCCVWTQRPDTSIAALLRDGHGDGIANWQQRAMDLNGWNAV